MNSQEDFEEANPPTLRKLFQDSGVAKLLDFLTLYKNFDYSKTEISRNSGVAWKTLYRIWPLLEKYGLVVKTRKIGRATMFKLNTENPVAKAVWELAFQIAKYDVDKSVEEELKKLKKVVARVLELNETVHDLDSEIEQVVKEPVDKLIRTPQVVFRRSLREKGPLSLKTRPSKKREGEILQVAKSPVVTMAPTTPIYDGIRIMTKKGFRRIPIANPGTRTLEGIVTATDIINYLGGGKKFQIIQKKFKGNFFKAINEPIKLIMTKKVVSVKTSAKISEAIELMKKQNLGALPVVDDENRLRAIITERDVINMFADRISGVTIAQLMSKKVVTASPKTTIFEAANTITRQGFRRLPIISNDKVVGIITAMDVMRFFGSRKVFKYLKSGTIIQVLNRPALEIATKEVLTIGPDADLSQAAKIMQEKNIGALPVVKNKKLVGIITERDFFKIIV